MNGSTASGFCSDRGYVASSTRNHSVRTAVMLGIDLHDLIPKTRTTFTMPAAETSDKDHYLAISKRLLDHAKVHGFYFRRARSSVDAPLVGTRYRAGITEVVRIDGWRHNCQAWRQPSRLVLAKPPTDATDYVSGSALNVLNRVVCW